MLTLKEAPVSLVPSTSELIAFGGALVELIVDEVLANLAPRQPIKSAKLDWIVPVAKQAPIGHLLFARLLDSGILHREEERSLFGPSRSTFYPVEPSVIQQLAERERQVMVDNAKPDPHTAALLFMVSVWGSSRLGKLADAEKKAYQKRWDDLFSDYWGAYPGDHEMEPIAGLDPAVGSTMGHVTVAWFSAQASYVAADFSRWNYISKINIV